MEFPDDTFPSLMCGDDGDDDHDNDDDDDVCMYKKRISECLPPTQEIET